MKMFVVGLGPFGCSYAVWLCSKGHKVLGIDINEKIVESVNNGEILFDEPQVEELLQKALENGSFRAVSNYSDPEIGAVDLAFVIVQTPLNENTQMLDYQCVIKALCSLLKANDNLLVVIRSTVPLGAMKELETIYSRIVYMPEFLAYSRIIEDFENPSSHLIGGDEEICAPLIEMLEEIDDTPIYVVKFGSAELAKLGINVALSTKVSLINQLEYIADLYPDVDINEVYEILVADKRFNPAFLRPGATFGGKCFIKDMRNLITQSNKKGYEPKFIEGIFELRDQYAIREVDKMGDVENVVLSGLSYKEDINFVDHSPGMLVLSELVKRGVNVTVIEKQEVIEHAKKWMKDEKEKVNWVECDKYIRIVPG